MPALLYRCILHKWRAFRPEDTWTDPLTTPAAFQEIVPGTGIPGDRALQRGIAIGLRPPEQSSSPEAFALVRGLTIHELEAQAHATAVAIQKGLRPLAADLYRAVAISYRNITSSLQAALQGGLHREARVEQRMLAAGLDLMGPTPTQRWRERWQGICNQNGQQTLLPNEPWDGRQVGQQNTLRLAPRPDWAPPSALPV